MNTLITICARAGSKGLPNKHLLPFCGKPLIEWTIELECFGIRHSEYHIFGDAIISSDSHSILAIAEKYERDIRFRPKELSQYNTPKLDVIRDALKYAEEIKGKNYDCVMDLDATNPCRTIEDIKNCFRIFEEKRLNTVVSVVKAKKNPHFNQIVWDYRDLQYTIAKSNPFSSSITARQDTPEIYDVNSNIYVYDTNWLRDEKNLSPITDETKIYVMPEWTRHDIDDEYDFFDCENNFRKYILKQ